MAGLNFSPGMRGQFAAIAQVRWQLFVNRLRTIRGRRLGRCAHPRLARLAFCFTRASPMARHTPLVRISVLAAISGDGHSLRRNR